MVTVSNAISALTLRVHVKHGQMLLLGLSNDLQLSLLPQPCL
jgi:hypothetical protein